MVQDGEEARRDFRVRESHAVRTSAALQPHLDRVAHVHFKDIRPDGLARVDGEELTFWQAIKAGVFCPMGAGMVDTAGVLQALDRIGYDGFATIEQDRLPCTGAPLSMSS